MQLKDEIIRLRQKLSILHVTLFRAAIDLHEIVNDMQDLINESKNQNSQETSQKT